jgi:hypothetical protein
MKLTIGMLMAVSLLPAAEIKVADSLQADGVRRQILIGAMSTQEFVNAALKLLGPPDVKLGVLINYLSYDDRFLAGPPNAYHCSYESWTSRIAALKLSSGECPEVREAIKLGSSLIYRSVNRNCRVEHKLLLGKGNPLVMDVGGTAVHVLYVDIGGPGEGDKLHRLNIGFYAMVSHGEATEGLGRALLTKMRPLVGPAEIWVNLREDSWFLADCGFPAFYGFEERAGAPPSKEKFLQSKRASCWAIYSRPVQCETYGGGAEHPTPIAAAQYRGLVVGHSTNADIRRVFGKPTRVDDFPKDDEAAYIYAGKEGTIEQTIIRVKKSSGKVRRIEVYPSNLTVTEAIAQFGPGFRRVRYAFDACESDGESAPIVESTSGNLEFLEYRAKGIYLQVGDTPNSVASIGYANEPPGSPRSRCR